MKHAPALLIAGTHSGCGKTTLTLGVMAALRRRGLEVRPFKCGPDFIDPTLHEMVCGRLSRNLDLRMCGEDFVRSCFNRHHLSAPGQPGVAVVEGVMGLFDGAEGSAAHLAKTLNLPVLLVVDVRSAAESVAAVVKGFATLDPELTLAGVICNRVGSARHAELIRAALDPLGIPLLGFLPREETIAIPSRHLGLHMGTEHPLDQAGLAKLANLVETHLDLDRLLQIANQAVEQTGQKQLSSAEPRESAPYHVHSAAETVRIGLAQDAAFLFYYADNLDMLKAAGAELVSFSPIADADLPDNLQGLYLGGGYPELYAQQLAANKTMRKAIRRFSEAGGPVYAECGGFMYLCESLRDLNDSEFSMCGIFPFACAMGPRLRRLGYRHVRQSQASLLGPAGSTFYGHEFHYSSLAASSQNTSPPATACIWQVEDGGTEGYQRNHTLAGYIHLHWGRSPQAPAAFVQTCRTFAS